MLWRKCHSIMDKSVICKNGHRRTKENIKIEKSGYRRCLESYRIAVENDKPTRRIMRGNGYDKRILNRGKRKERII